MIGIQYLITSLTFLLLGFLMVLLMRWSIAYPNQPLTAAAVVSKITEAPAGYAHRLGENVKALFGYPHDFKLKETPPPKPEQGTLAEFLFTKHNMPGGVMQPSFYNQLGAMHGTIMVFLAVVPLGFAAFGNFVVPLQIGAGDMCFPRLNMASFHLFFWGGVMMLASFAIPGDGGIIEGGGPQSGWTSYPPLSILSNPAIKNTILLNLFTGQSFWLMSMVLLITSSLLGSVNFIATIVQLRAPGMTWMRMPFFVWAQLVTAFLLLLAFPPLEAAGILQLMDRVAHTSFFMPDGLVWENVPVAASMGYSGGGSPLLYQHLFWFLGHPEVYVLILPTIGAVTEIIATNARKPIWGLNTMVVSVWVLGFLSFVVWAHHMYLTGMGTKVAAFFQTTTIIISIPSVLILTALLITLWGASIRFTVPMLFATAFIPLFGIGGLTGIPLAFSAPVLYLHDTYYVIGHFHYVVAPGVITGAFGAIYHWYPKATGRKMSDFLGHVHFWPTILLMNCVFMPMFLQGMSGMHRRGYDGGAAYGELLGGVLYWHQFITVSAFFLLLAQIPFIFNFFYSAWFGEKVSTNPWHCTTLEWDTPSPPPHGNFTKPIQVYRGPYEYSVPGHPTDYFPQTEPGYDPADKFKGKH